MATQSKTTTKKPTQKEAITEVSKLLDTVSKKYNFHVAPTSKAGKPAKVSSYHREFRMQMINTTKDTSGTYKTSLVSELKSVKTIMKVVFNDLSPNSSKYSSVSFVYAGYKFDAIVSRGANKGENFEKSTISNLALYVTGKSSSKTYKLLLEKMTQSNPAFATNEITSVKQRTGSTKKEGIPTAELGAIIGDIVVKDSANRSWYISLKDTNGNTFSSYSGAASLFDVEGTLQPNSAGAAFLKSFGVDLNKVQAGFDERNGISEKRKKIATSTPNAKEMKAIFERAWGMNYFYVRKKSGDDWKVFWLDRRMLNKLTDNMTVTRVNYPNGTSKQITIYCSTPAADYTIELRNSKGKEYPNDTKFKIINFKGIH